jgi:hypothetical protein
MIIAYNYDEAYVGKVHSIPRGRSPPKFNWPKTKNTLATWILYLDDISMKCDDDLKEKYK